RRAVGGVLSPFEPALAAEGLRLLTPDAEQRPHDAVLSPHLDPRRPPARGEAIEDRLHLVRRGVPGRAQAAGMERVADVAELGLVAAARRRLHHLGAEALGAPAGVLVGLLAAQPVVDVQRGDAVAE